MYYNYLKWSLYARFKRKLANIKVFNNLSPKILLTVYGVIQLVKLISVISITNLMLNNSYILIDNKYIDSILKLIQQKKIILIVFFLLYIILEVTNNAFKAVKIKHENFFKEWMLANTVLNEKKINFIMLLEYIIFSSVDVITVQAPIVGVICYKNSFSIPAIIVIIILFELIIISLTILIALIYDMYLTFFIKNNKNKWVLIKNIIERIVSVIIFYILGVSLSSWMNDFPLINRYVEAKVFENWINSFQINNMYKFESYLTESFKYIQNINELYIIINMIAIVIILLCLINISMGISKKINKNNTIINKSVTKKYRKKPNLFSYYFKTVIKSEYVLRNQSAFLGGIFYWAIIGFYMGLLKYVDVNSKVYYFVVISYIFYPSFLLTESIFEKLIGKYSFDGEGKKIYFWIGKNKFKLFKYKRQIISLNLIAIAIVTNLLIGIINQLSIILIIKSIFLQVIFSYTIFNVLSTPSVITPHFQYKNIEELNDYIDKKEFKNLLSFFSFIIGIPILVLPTALYLTDYINNNSLYNYIQFYVVIILLIIINYFIDKFIISKVNDNEYNYKIFDY